MKKYISLLLLFVFGLKADTFLDDYRRLVETGDGQGINLKGLHLGPMLTALNKKHKQGLNLSFSNLEGTNLENASLHNTNFDNASLKGATLINFYAPFASFQQAKLDKAVIKNSTFYFANFNESTLDRANIDIFSNFRMAAMAISKWSAIVSYKGNVAPFAFEKGAWPYNGPTSPIMKLNTYLAKRDHARKLFENNQKNSQK